MLSHAEEKTKSPSVKHADASSLEVRASGRLSNQLLRWAQSAVSADVLAPLGVGLLMLTLWEVGVRITETPPFLLPGPVLVFQTLIQDWAI